MKDKGQTNVLMLGGIILGIIIVLLVAYNVAVVIISREKYDPWVGQGELTTLKKDTLQKCSSPGSDEECDDKNDCTQDICGNNKICEYTNKSDGAACLLEKTVGACKDGKCLP